MKTNEAQQIENDPVAMDAIRLLQSKGYTSIQVQEALGDAIAAIRGIINDRRTQRNQRENGATK